MVRIGIDILMRDIVDGNLGEIYIYIFFNVFWLKVE